MTLEQLIEAKGFYLYPHTGKVLKATDVEEWLIQQMQAGNIKPAATRGGRMKHETKETIAMLLCLGVAVLIGFMVGMGWM